MQNNDDSKIITLINWLAENATIRNRICVDGYEVTPEEFIETLEVLENNNLHELSIVLLIKNLNNRVLEQARTRLVIEKIGNEWARIGTKQMYEDMKNIIIDEISKQKNNTN